jgi:hypothetical protein
MEGKPPTGGVLGGEWTALDTRLLALEQAISTLAFYLARAPVLNESDHAGVRRILGKEGPWSSS